MHMLLMRKRNGQQGRIREENTLVRGTMPPHVTLPTAALESQGSLGGEQHIQLHQALLEASYALIIV